MAGRGLSLTTMYAARSILFALTFLTGAPLWAGDVTVYAAASLKTALDKVAAVYDSKGLGNVTLSYAGSSALARQIEAGAPVDVFLSANTDWMDYLGGKSLIAPETRRDLLSNRLALIAPSGTAMPQDIGPDLPLTDMLAGGVLAMALVEAVPAGIYGKAALTSLDLWDEARPSVAQTDNVRAALRLVAVGEAPLGIVYATDAAAEPRVTIIGLFAEATHPPIRYPVAAVADREDAAAPFLDWLSTPEAKDIFRAEGFGVIGE